MTGSDLLLEACENGDIAEALARLDGGDSLAHEGADRRTPWNALIERWDFAFLQRLAGHPQSGVDAPFLDEQLRRRVTGLGSTEDRLGEIVILRALGAKPPAQEDCEAMRPSHWWAVRWPLHAAASFGMDPVCCDLLRQGHDAREESDSAHRPATAIGLAVRHGQTQTASLISAWLAREEAQRQVADGLWSADRLA